MQIVLVAVNAAVALLSGGSSLVGLVRPSVALAEGEQLGAGGAFFLGAYAARALPLSLVTLVVLLAGSAVAQVPVLVVAGLAQVGDAVVGARRGNRPMAASCIGLALIHLASAAWLFTR
ncbi:hypothetical protein E6W39_28745 [Kitasatospora acidiphila]|uniref:DUF4267 domain-containing protein n=1 Tax=Kitasatospora acidiphila TaxID=2567942 RepID=A0A540W919_9ACTN|nr:hypothetical protein [Kitasatospora acidiphila]TQF05492.1 hypothetical protein E6W39_28745 [Kitasatospora acidiphila]